MSGAEELSKQVGSKAACDAIGVSRATLYRRRRPKTSRRRCRRPTPPRSLTPHEKQEVIDVLHAEPFVDMAPRAIHAALLEAGRYLCSPRTMYRILAGMAENGARRQQRTHFKYARPELMARAPNEVWTWDVTWLRGPEKGDRYALYIMVDIFSRYVIGWMLAHAENGELASDFVRQCHASQAVDSGALTVHSDRGAAQKSEKVATVADMLEIGRSFSRPRVCNDNPFSEAINKTVKYHLDFPDRFAGFDEAREFCRRFFAWYNDDHRHSGIAMLTPAVVHAGEHDAVITARQAALDAAYAAKPERFVHGPPRTHQLPSIVYLNKPEPKPEPVAHYS